MQKLKLGSLFDGIGGWCLSAVRYNVKPIWASEIEKFPIVVSKKHFPNMLHLGDVKNINGGEIEPVDILCFGFPCQSVSVAGKGEGFKGESGLFYEAIRIVEEMRKKTDGKYPRFIVIENVTGLLSNDKGLTFKTVLEEIGQVKLPMPTNGRKWANAGLVELPRCQIAWRVLDAQYWGTAQRRKRVFLVADFGGKCAGEILFVEKGLSRDSQESRESRQRVTSRTQEGFGDTESRIAVYDMTHADEVMRPIKGDKVNTLNARMGTGGNQVPVIHTFSNVASTLRANAGMPKHLSDFTGRLVYALQGNMIGRDDKNGPQGSGINENVSFTLNTVDRHAVALPVDAKKTIRRLTPTECERLQGLPDGYTNVLVDGKAPSDAARYKALGNGMAQPCADYVIRRIVDVLGGSCYDQ